jgi:uncharacterized DUF497 family protein
MGLRFEWDPKKAEANLRNHGVTFVEASTVFAYLLARIKDDPDHSLTEDRYIIVGMSKKFRILVVVFTERHDSIRIITSRLATKEERTQYEEKQHF